MRPRFMVAMLSGGLLLWGQAVSAPIMWERTIDGKWVINKLGTLVQSFGP